MVIVEREGKYFLQISNGELELSEKQAKARLERGARLEEDSYVPEGTAAHALGDTHSETEREAEPRVEGSNNPGFDVREEQNEEYQQAETKSQERTSPYWENDEPAEANDIEDPIAEPEAQKEPATPITKIPAEAQAFILSDEYYDNIIREFEKVYVANDRKEETALQLLDHCQKSIDHLKLERSQPGADLALLDYQRICWLRIVVFLQALTGVPAPKHPETLAQEKEKADAERTLVKQLLVIQLLQETGAFPYADALKSITHDSIVGLVSRIINKDKNIVKNNMQRSGDILLRRNVSVTNAPKRLRLLMEIETYFSDLPYNHVIIRLKSLKEFYKNYNNKIS